MRVFRTALIAVVLFSTIGASAQIEEITKQLGIGQTSGLSDTKIASGLKEALQVGANNAVKLTGQKDGYFGNAAIKILMPKSMRPVETGLRAIGYGPKVDEFVLSMNRAAEKAAPQAKKIFGDAILSMSFEDARKILKGNDTAATEYFKSKTTADLTTAFRPIVEQSMKDTGVTRQYEDLVGKYQTLPFMKSPSLDINNYVVSQALNGLFFMLGEEEKKIRKNPAARVTSLLKEVFKNR
jgi:hypothetical protein